MEDKTTQATSSTNDFEGLPSLNSDNTRAKTGLRKRMRTLKLKALSLPVDLKNREGMKGIGYKISDHYNLMQKLGFGTYSEVRRGINKKTEEVFAIKISKGQTSGALLKNEADILEEISSEYIPKFYEFQRDTCSNRCYLVMEYVKGVSLDTYISQNGPLSEEASLKILKQLIEAVKELHSNGIAHRDIKPQNIIITEEMNLKLIDLNISKRMKEPSSSDDEKGKFKSVFFTQISSPMYAAPELALLECYSESIDIWGIGVAFSEMLFNISGEKILQDKENIGDLIKELQSSTSVSDESVSWVKSMLSTDPELRPTIYELSDHFSKICA